MISQMTLLDHASHVEAMRARFEQVMSVVGMIYDQRHASPALRHAPIDQSELQVLAALNRLEMKTEQAAREWERGDQAAAEETCNHIFILIQGDLLPRLQALAAAEGDSLVAEPLRAWVEDVATLVESEAT